jgi:hypothetical protein
MIVEETRTVREKVSKVKKLISLAGNQMVGITFTKRSDGCRRKIAGRFRVSKPQYASIPSGKKMRYSAKDKNLATIFDCNALKYNNGRLCGRGAWKSFGLDMVERFKVNGIIHKFV